MSSAEHRDPSRLVATALNAQFNMFAATDQMATTTTYQPAMSCVDKLSDAPKLAHVSSIDEMTHLFYQHGWWETPPPHSSRSGTCNRAGTTSSTTRCQCLRRVLSVREEQDWQRTKDNTHPFLHLPLVGSALGP